MTQPTDADRERAWEIARTCFTIGDTAYAIVTALVSARQAAREQALEEAAKAMPIGWPVAIYADLLFARGYEKACAECAAALSTLKEPTHD